MRYLTSILLLLLFLTGCGAEQLIPEDKEWKVSPLFISGAYSMIG
ncbi:hypothetical protein [Paenibacillus phytorum]|nr:hypothetical protein [Paenibacillus phytorum]